MYNSKFKINNCLEVCGDFINLFEVVENLCLCCPNLLGKVHLLLRAELGVPPQQLTIQHIPLWVVKVLLPGAEHPT